MQVIINFHKKCLAFHVKHVGAEYTLGKLVSGVLESGSARFILKDVHRFDVEMTDPISVFKFTTTSQRESGFCNC